MPSQLPFGSRLLRHRYHYVGARRLFLDILCASSNLFRSLPVVLLILRIDNKLQGGRNIVFGDGILVGSSFLTCGGYETLLRNRILVDG